jgi:hypothetical protein
MTDVTMDPTGMPTSLPTLIEGGASAYFDYKIGAIFGIFGASVLGILCAHCFKSPEAVQTVYFRTAKVSLVILKRLYSV